MKIADYVKKGFRWLEEVPELSKLRLCSNMLLTPGVLILLFYAVTGKLLNILLIYVPADLLILFGIVKHEQIRRKYQSLEVEAEGSGTALKNVRHKLESMRKSEEN